MTFDISQAFDRVWHAGLLPKLRSYGISGQLVGPTPSYLSNRWLLVVWDGKKFGSFWTVSCLFLWLLSFSFFFFFCKSVPCNCSSALHGVNIKYELIHFWPILTSITSILTESSSCFTSCTIIANLSSCLNNFIRKRENDMVLVHENQR